MEIDFKKEFERMSADWAKTKSPDQHAMHERYALGNRNRAQEFLAYLRGSLGWEMAGKRVLDIGSAYAGFPIACAAAGGEAVGVEIDPELHRLGVINARGEPGKITLIEGDILDQAVMARLGPAPFDLISLNDVFEHVYDSVALFERLAALSGPATIIYFGTPNGNSYHAIENEGHFSRPGLSLLPPAEWAAVVGPFNVYYRRLRHYQALFQSCRFNQLYLTIDMALLGEVAKIVPERFAALANNLSAKAFDGNEALWTRAARRLKQLRGEIAEAIARKDWLGLHLAYGQHTWTGFATREPHPTLQSQATMVSLGQYDARGQMAARTLEPAMLTADDFVDVGSATMETQSGKISNARVPMGEERRRAGITLTNSNDPRRGDFTRWRWKAPLDPKRNYLLCVFVKNEYENPTLSGRVEWRLAVNGQLIHSEDIGLSAARQKLKAFVFGAERLVVELEVRALRDCEAWHWGQAATTFIDGITIQECPAPLPAEPRAAAAID